MPQHDEPRTVDEAYSSAGNTSDMRVLAERRGDADILIAAGLSPSRFGLLLLRLHSEFDATSRLPAGAGAHEFALRLQRCKSLPAARAELQLQADRRAGGINAAAVLLWWLDRSCGACEGRRWQRVKDTPALSGKVCGACSGSGERTLPGGENGKKLAVYVEDCLAVARDSIRRRLRSDLPRG